MRGLLEGHQVRLLSYSICSVKMTCTQTHGSKSAKPVCRFVMGWNFVLGGRALSICPFLFQITCTHLSLDKGLHCQSSDQIIPASLCSEAWPTHMHTHTHPPTHSHTHTHTHTHTIHKILFQSHKVVSTFSSNRRCSSLKPSCT